jgi:hypothetical protein
LDSGYRPQIVGFHDRPDQYMLAGDVPLTVLATESARPGTDSAVSHQLWEIVATADIVHVIQPAHATGAAAMIVAASLRKTVIATYLGDGGLGMMLYEDGLALADRIVFHDAKLMQSMASATGRGAVCLPDFDSEQIGQDMATLYADVQLERQLR